MYIYATAAEYLDATERLCKAAEPCPRWLKPRTGGTQHEVYGEGCALGVHVEHLGDTSAWTIPRSLGLDTRAIARIYNRHADAYLLSTAAIPGNDPDRAAWHRTVEEAVDEIRRLHDIPVPERDDQTAPSPTVIVNELVYV